MKISLVEKLIAHAKGKYPHAINGGEFEVLAFNEGKKASNASRRCRELVDAGVFERIAGKSVSYRWIPRYEKIPQRKKEKRFYDHDLVTKINKMESKQIKKVEQTLFS